MASSARYTTVLVWVACLLLVAAGLRPAAAAPVGEGPTITLGEPLSQPGARGGTFNAGPVLDFNATTVGWVYSYPVVVINPELAPWEVTVNAGNFLLSTDPSRVIPRSRIQFRVPGQTDWANVPGSVAKAASQSWMQVEFRVEVTYADPPGTYLADAALAWAIDSAVPTEGSIPLELHLHIPEFFAVSLEPSTLDFGTTPGDFVGWIYSNEATLRVLSNVDYQISLSSGADLTGAASYQLPTALRLRLPVGTGATWGTWGDLGGTPHGQATDPWSVPLDGGSPWPGAVGGPAGTGIIPTVGDNPIGLTAGAWRSGVVDLAGDYTTALVLTVSQP